ncbi:MAG: hypothetical protein ACE5LC_00350 [Candidatus Aminicenantales bacterium]
MLWLVSTPLLSTRGRKGGITPLFQGQGEEFPLPPLPFSQPLFRLG